jgi:hypothetical protein
MARTRGCQRRRSSWGGTTGTRVPSWSGDGAGGRRVVVVDGNGPWRKMIGVSVTHRGTLVGGSPWGWPVGLEGEAAKLACDLDSVGITLRWPTTVSKPVGSGEWSRGKGVCEDAKGERRTLLLGASTGIRPLAHVGWQRPAVTGVSTFSAVSTVTAWWPALWWAGVGPGIGCPGWSPFWAAACGLGLVKRFSNIQN